VAASADDNITLGEKLDGGEQDGFTMINKCGKEDGSCPLTFDYKPVVKTETTPSADVGLVKKSFDAYMVLEEDLELGQYRLLETDHKLYLPS